MGRKSFRDFKSDIKLRESNGAGAGAGAGTNTGTGASNNSASTADAKRTGAGAGTATSGTGAGTSTKEKKPLEVAIVVPETKETKETEKKPRKRKPKKEEYGANEIGALIESVSLMVASRDGLEQWKLSHEETMKIAEPLTNILKKSDVFSKIAEHGDGIALVTACGMIFTPRIMITAEQIKKKKTLKKGAKYSNVKPINTGRKDNESGKAGNNNQSNSGNIATNGKTTLDFIPSTVPELM